MCKTKKTNFKINFEIPPLAITLLLKPSATNTYLFIKIEYNRCWGENVARVR